MQMKVLVLDQGIKTLHTLSPLVLMSTGGWHDHYVHFTGEKTMA